jgi:hypothetical protein
MTRSGRRRGLRGEDVRGGRTVFSDVDLFEVPELGGKLGRPIDGLRPDVEPVAHHVG